MFLLCVLFFLPYRQASRKARLSTFTHTLDEVYVSVFVCLGDHFLRHFSKYIFQNVHRFLFHVIPAHSRPVESALPSFSLFPWSSFSLSTTLTYFKSAGVLLSPSHVRIATLHPTAITNFSVVPSSGMTNETWIPSVRIIKVINKHRNKMIKCRNNKTWMRYWERDLHCIHHGREGQVKVAKLSFSCMLVSLSNQYQVSFTRLDYAIGQLDLSFQVLFKAGPNIYHHHCQHYHHHFMVCTSVSQFVFLRTSHHCSEPSGSMQCEDGFHK